MISPRNRSLRWKLALLTMVGSSIGLVVALIASLVYNESVAREHKLEELKSTGQLIGTSSVAALVFDDSAEATRVLQALQFRKHIHLAALYRGDGTLFATYLRKADIVPAAREYANEEDRREDQQLEDRLVDARESMRFQATHDVLTSLWNRGAILELLSVELGRSRREASCTAVMMCDIDHFKSINDRFGHAAGDDVLREVSKRFQNAVRSYDMVSRYGGEEFVVVLNRCNPENAVSRAEQLRQAIAGRPVATGTEDLQVTVSIGLALSTDFRNNQVEALVHEADMALYAAKEDGRNCVRTAHPPAPSNRENPGHPEPTMLISKA